MYSYVYKKSWSSKKYSGSINIAAYSHATETSIKIILEVVKAH